MITDDILYVGAAIIVSILTLSFTWFQKKGSKVSFLKTFFISLLLFAVASVWWFVIAPDGFSQVFGVIIYGAVFLVITLVNVIIAWILRKQHHKKFM